MMKRFGVLAAAVLAGLAGAAAAQEGTGAIVFRLRGDEIENLYPAAAKAKGVEGEALVNCQTKDSAIWGCVLTSESPAGEGFGPAALALVKRYDNGPLPPAGLDRVWPRLIRVPFRLPGEGTLHAGGATYDLPRGLDIPSPDALYGAWPSAARFSGVEGSANLWCTVNVAGRLEACTVAKESQPGLGFGEAALKLTPLYRFTPARKNGAPAAMSIPMVVVFACDVRCRSFEGARPAPPHWARVPTPGEVQAAYPAAARARGLEGQARLDCLTVREGGLADCRVVAEAPAGQGFGTAALSLAGLFSATDREPWRVSFSVAFDKSAAVGRVDWVRGDYPRSAAGPTPQPTSNARPVEGRSRLRCQAAQGGRLESCIVLDSVPPDPEVARLALDNVDQVRVRDWTEEGRSTIGATVELTVSAAAIPGPRLVEAPPAALPVVAPGVLDYRPQATLSPQMDVSRFYPDRAQRMEVNGRVVLKCKGVNNGHPETCEVASENPLDYGFGDAALRMARIFRYSPRTLDGVPTDDPVMIPFDFAIPR